MLQIKTYKFKCLHCGCTTAHVRQHKITEYKLLEACTDVDMYGLSAVTHDKPVRGTDRFSYTTVVCKNCRAEWGNLSQAGNAGNLTLVKEQTKRNRNFIEKNILPEHSVNSHIKTGDAVRCVKDAPYMIAKFSPACAFILSCAMVNAEDATCEDTPIIAWQPGTLDHYIYGKVDAAVFSIRTQQDTYNYTTNRTWLSVDLENDKIHLHCSEENNHQDTPFPEYETIAHAQLSRCALWALARWKKEAVDFDTTP